MPKFEAPKLPSFGGGGDAARWPHRSFPTHPSSRFEAPKAPGPSFGMPSFTAPELPTMPKFEAPSCRTCLIRHADA